MNIGHWITVSFILFAAFIGILVTVCVKEDISLVSKNYYQEEIAYQEQIQRMENAAHLEEKPVIKVIANQIQIEFPDVVSVEKGELKLFCPSNSAMDRTFRVAATGHKVQTFKLQHMQPGLYKAKLLWSMNGKEYYQEETIYI